jgi:hypothetical protein
MLAQMQHKKIEKNKEDKTLIYMQRTFVKKLTLINQISTKRFQQVAQILKNS